MTKEKERKTKNLPRIPTKTGKLIITKTNQQTGNGKKLIRERERRKKKKLFSPSALDGQNDKKNGITNHVLHVELFYLMKECGITFLGMEKHAQDMSVHHTDK
ncbi:hypothetical protein G9A89_005157 [Geosiphon pyriformis]|nr:hypothetical protein G9A89_005157 [Geosiphon pyriformis]